MIMAAAVVLQWLWGPTPGAEAQQSANMLCNRSMLIKLKPKKYHCYCLLDYQGHYVLANLHAWWLPVVMVVPLMQSIRGRSNNDGIYVNPHMRTISLCVMGSPSANFSAIRARLHTGIPICIRYGDPHMQNYAFGDTKLSFPYVHNFIMHTGSDWKIPVCIQGLVSIRSPYAYGDHENPRMHTGITY